MSECMYCYGSKTLPSSVDDNGRWNGVQRCFYCQPEKPKFYYGSPDSPYEVIKVIEAWGLQKDAYLFNVIKYVARAGKKDATKELEDLKKALYYLQRKIDKYESTQNPK